MATLQLEFDPPAVGRPATMLGVAPGLDRPRRRDSLRAIPEEDEEPTRAASADLERAGSMRRRSSFYTQRATSPLGPPPPATAAAEPGHPRSRASRPSVDTQNLRAILADGSPSDSATNSPQIDSGNAPSPYYSKRRNSTRMSRHAGGRTSFEDSSNGTDSHTSPSSGPTASPLSTSAPSNPDYFSNFSGTTTHRHGRRTATMRVGHHHPSITLAAVGVCV